MLNENITKRRSFRTKKVMNDKLQSREKEKKDEKKK